MLFLLFKSKRRGNLAARLSICDHDLFVGHLAALRFMGFDYGS
jgi:hypothetical protein